MQLQAVDQQTDFLFNFEIYCKYNNNNGIRSCYFLVCYNIYLNLDFYDLADSTDLDSVDSRHEKIRIQLDCLYDLMVEFI
jgi:hypothetical protein